jgi:hypothetical protein
VAVKSGAVGVSTTRGAAGLGKFKNTAARITIRTKTSSDARQIRFFPTWATALIFEITLSKKFNLVTMILLPERLK